MKAHEPIPLAAVRAARERIADSILRTPLIRLNVEDAPAEIYIKPENLQPTGSFKLRGARNVIGIATAEQLARGIYTVSSGNMAQAAAYLARKFGLPCTAIVPDNAPRKKLAAIKQLGAEYVQVPYEQWWDIMLGEPYAPLQDRLFIHPSSDPGVMAGYATMGLEILEDLPDVDAVIIPYGSGGSCAGIGSLFRELKPDTKIYAGEVDTGAPLAASLAAGSPQEVPFTASFVDGISAKNLLLEMWPLVSSVVDEALVMDLASVEEAIRVLAERQHLIVEGAGATQVAAALSGKAGSGKVACIISGGNIDTPKFVNILQGRPA